MTMSRGEGFKWAFGIDGEGTKWERFKRSLGPMSEEQTEAWRPISYAMKFVGGLYIAGFIIAVIYTHVG
jgi:hypothetical protein